MIFVDASALVAILAREPDEDRFLAEIARAPRRIYSALTHWETVAALCRSHRFPVSDARSAVVDFLETFSFEPVPVGLIEAEIAADAYAIYGKGRHPAALNMGTASPTPAPRAMVSAFYTRETISRARTCRGRRAEATFSFDYG